MELASALENSHEALKCCYRRKQDLQSFILRARVLKLYRQALKIAQRAPADVRGELKQTIRQEVEKNSECEDKQKIRYLISEGLERIKRLDEMLDMQGH